MGNYGRKFVGVVLAVMIVVSLEGTTVLGGFCGIKGVDLMKCRPAVSGPRARNPSRKCCAVLKRADLRCLCRLRNSKQLPLVGIDPHLAMRLPAKCGLATPPACRH